MRRAGHLGPLIRLAKVVVNTYCGSCSTSKMLLCQGEDVMVVMLHAVCLSRQSYHVPLLPSYQLPTATMMNCRSQYSGQHGVLQGGQSHPVLLLTVSAISHFTDQLLLNGHARLPHLTLVMLPLAQSMLLRFRHCPS